MPHLSPLNWLLIPMFLILMLLTITTLLWWQFSPLFPALHNNSANSLSTQWPW